MRVEKKLMLTAKGCELNFYQKFDDQIVEFHSGILNVYDVFEKVQKYIQKYRNYIYGIDMNICLRGCNLGYFSQ